MSAERAALLPSMSLAEFLEWPGDGTAKHYQLVDGDVVAMSPASATHGIIQATLGRLIGERLAATGSGCVVAAEPAVVPRLRASANVRVPDLGVTCSRIERGQIEMPEPVLLVEILSPGNERLTRGAVWAYASIPSVREILLVHSTDVAAELLRRRQDESWPDDPQLLAAGETLRLETVDLTCPLADLYVGTYLA